MKIKKAFGTDATLENEGVWVELGDGAAIKVARIGNKAHAAALKDLGKPYRELMRLNKLPPDVLEEIAIKSMAAGVLLDWKGIEADGSSEPLPFTQENAIAALRVKDFRDLVATYASNMAIFQKEDEEAATKN